MYINIINSSFIYCLSFFSFSSSSFCPFVCALADMAASAAITKTINIGNEKTKKKDNCSQRNENKNKTEEKFFLQKKKKGRRTNNTDLKKKKTT